MTRLTTCFAATLWLAVAPSAPATSQESESPTASAEPATQQQAAASEEDAAPWAERVTLIVNGAYDVSSLSYAQTTSITEFVEQGSLRSSYAVDPSAGFDVALQVRVVRSFIVTAALSQVSRTPTGEVDARVPHPLYFDRPRSASRDLEDFGFDYSERAVHLGVGWQHASGAARLVLFGGLSLFRVSTDLVDGIDFAQSYPYDEITLTGLRLVERDHSPKGFHVGGRVDWKLSERFGLGAQLRFSRATAELGGTSTPLEIDAGGLQLAAGLRLFL